MDRATSASLVKSRTSISRAVLFCPRDNMEQTWVLHRIPVPFYEHGLRQKTVHNKKGASDMLRNTETVTEHLYHMGNRCSSKTTADGTVPIINLEKQYVTTKYLP